jgi:hypothetical protein
MTTIEPLRAVHWSEYSKLLSEVYGRHLNGYYLEIFRTFAQSGELIGAVQTNSQKIMAGICLMLHEAQNATMPIALAQPCLGFSSPWQNGKKSTSLEYLRLHDYLFAQISPRPLVGLSHRARAYSKIFKGILQPRHLITLSRDLVRGGIGAVPLKSKLPVSTSIPERTLRANDKLRNIKIANGIVNHFHNKERSASVFYNLHGGNNTVRIIDYYGEANFIELFLDIMTKESALAMELTTDGPTKNLYDTFVELNSNLKPDAMQASFLISNYLNELNGLSETAFFLNATSFDFI